MVNIRALNSSKALERVGVLTSETTFRSNQRVSERKQLFSTTYEQYVNEKTRPLTFPGVTTTKVKESGGRVSLKIEM